MNLFDKIKPEGWPIGIKVSSTRYTLVLREKCDISQLTICVPVAIKRERSLGRVEKLDIVHAFPDGTARFTHVP